MKETDVEKVLNEFRQWVEAQKPVLNSPTTDEFLLRFLRVTNFELPEAKEWLVKFWKYRTENTNWFTNRDLIENPLMRQIAESGYCLQLPKRTKDDHLIFIMRIGHYNASCCTLDDACRYAFAVVDILNAQPEAQLNGFVILLDMSEVGQQHVGQFTNDFARRYINCWETMYPVHLHQVHFYNYPSLFDPVYGMFRTLYYRDVGEKIIFHSNVNEQCSGKNSLHNYIEPELLPKEYQGQLGCLDDINHQFIQWTRERNSTMLELEKYGVDLTRVSQLLDQIQQE